MANTIKQTGMVVEITDIDSDWSWLTRFPFADSGIELDSIQFNPGAADDKCVIKAGSETAASIFDVICKDLNEKNKYYRGDVYKVFFDFSASVISAGAKIIITFV